MAGPLTIAAILAIIRRAVVLATQLELPDTAKMLEERGLFVEHTPIPLNAPLQT